MLMTPMTPNVMASPIAASSRTEPSEMPVPGVLHRAPQSETRLDFRDAIGGGLAQGWRGIRRQPAEQAERLLVAAFAQHRDGVELIDVLGIRHGDDDRSPRGK